MDLISKIKSLNDRGISTTAIASLSHINRTSIYRMVGGSRDLGTKSKIILNEVLEELEVIYDKYNN